MNAYRNPAAAGAANEVALMPAELRANALLSFSLPTSSGSSACRAGHANDHEMPCIIEVTSRICHVTTSVVMETAMSSDTVVEMIG